jgi:hypothetical protein
VNGSARFSVRVGMCLKSDRLPRYGLALLAHLGADLGQRLGHVTNEFVASYAQSLRGIQPPSVEVVERGDGHRAATTASSIRREHTMRRLISTLAGLLLIGTTATNAFAADIETVWDHGMPVSLAQVGYTYNSYIMPTSLTTKKLDNGTRVEAWKFQGRAGQCVDITMRSTEFDSFMGIYVNNPSTGDLDKVAEDDDSAGGTDARIQGRLPSTGSYYVVVADATKRENAGRYTLRFDSCDTAPFGSTTRR